MTHTAPIPAAAKPHLRTFRIWLADQPQTQARELEMLLDVGLDGDRLELDRAGWIMFGNWLDWSANDRGLPKSRYVAAAALGNVVYAVLRSLPRVVAKEDVEAVAPGGVPGTQLAMAWE